MEHINLPNFYTHTVSFNQNENFSLLQFGKDLSSPGFVYPNYNNSYSITFVKSGKGTLESRGKIYHLQKNAAFISYPNELSIQTADTQEPWELYFFSFDGALVKNFLRRTVFKHNTVVYLKSSSLPKDILEAVTFMNNRSYSEFHAFEFLFKFLSHFDVQKSFIKADRHVSESKYVSEIKEYIQSNYLQPIKITDIANKLNINRSHLYRIFKNEVGMGVEEYIISIRINHSKILLRDTKIPVSSIANLIGYKNYTTFFKRFKEIVGMTPAEYRNSTTQ